MRKVLLLLLFISVAASGHLQGQSPDDMAKVLQECIDLKELTPYYPLNADGNYKQLVVMQHGVSFPSGIDVLFAEQPLLLRSKQEVMNGNNPYFLFWDFSISANNADVAFSYHLNPAAPDEVVGVDLNLEKSGTEWQIINSKIERR